MTASPPETVTLRPERRRWLLLFAFAVVLAVVCFWFASRDEASSWLAWLAAASFMLLALYAGLVAFGSGALLRLDRRGFVYQTPLRTTWHPWRDVSEVSPFKRLPHHVVMVSVDGGRRTIMLPDTYGRSAQDLSDLMNVYRAQAQLDANLAD